jgi:hypothetical protein
MIAIVLALLAQGGPPLLTDDPGTPGDGRVELNIAITAEKFRHETLYEAPLIDLNYGVGERVQLKVELPWLIEHKTPGSDASGLGNALLGIKYRFLDQEREDVDASVYPQVEFRTNPRSRRVGLVGEGLSLLLPVQAARDFGPIAVNVEFGYQIVEENEDAWTWGLALGREVSEVVELLGEVHGESGSHFDHGELVWNLGARVHLSEACSLLLSAGRGIRGESRSEPQFIAYLGLQLNF